MQLRVSLASDQSTGCRRLKTLNNVSVVLFAFCARLVRLRGTLQRMPLSVGAVPVLHPSLALPPVHRLTTAAGAAARMSAPPPPSKILQVYPTIHRSPSLPPPLSLRPPSAAAIAPVSNVVQAKQSANARYRHGVAVCQSVRTAVHGQQRPNRPVRGCHRATATVGGRLLGS